MLLLRSSSDSDPTCTIPTSSHRTPCPSTSRRTAVSAIDTASSSSSHAAHSRISSPSVYLPATPCAASSSAARVQCRGVYTSTAWMPAWRDGFELGAAGGSSCGFAVFCACRSLSRTMAAPPVALSARYGVAMAAKRADASLSRSSPLFASSALISTSSSRRTSAACSPAAAADGFGAPALRRVSCSMWRMPVCGCTASQCAKRDARSFPASATSDASPNASACAALTVPEPLRAAASTGCSVASSCRHTTSSSMAHANVALVSTMR